MNKIYKLVWSQARGCYVVASEFAKVHGKSARRAVVSAFVAAAMLAGASSAYAAGYKAYEAGGGSAKESFSIAIGDRTVAEGNASIALGSSAWAQSVYSIAVGAVAEAKEEYSIAIGHNNYARGAYSIAIGESAEANGANSIAFGSNSVASKADSIALGHNSVADQSNTVSVGSASIKRKIVNVAAGDITKATSTDAVNGGQLYTIANVAEKGNYIAAGTNVAGNLKILDTQVKRNADAITAEVSRAKAAEKTNKDAITAEVNRAKAAEKANADAINANTKAINAEVTRAKAAEKANADAITAEVSRAQAAEKVNADNIDANTKAIDAEVSRAEAAEKANADKINANTKAIDVEATRAKAAENANADAISAEASRAQAAEKVNTDNITTNAGNIAALRSDLSKDEARITKNEADIQVLATSGFFANKDNITFGESLTGNIVENSDGSHTFYIDVDKKSHVNFIDENRANLDVDLSSKGLIASDSTAEGEFNVNVNEKGMTVAHDNDQVNVSAEGILVGNKPMSSAAADTDTSYVEITKEGIDMGGNKVSNLGEGDLSAESTDAVNGAQLFATNEAVAANTDAIAAETTRAKAAEKANADAIENNTTEIVKNKADIETNRVHIKDNAEAIAAETTRAKAAEKANADAIAAETTRAKAAEKANADAIATEKTERINADNELRNEIQGVNSNVNNKINQTNARVDRVGATAAALAGIHYQPMAKGQSQVAVGMGGYKGKKATALGLSYQFNDRVSGSIAGAANASEHMFNVGFNYLFGQHSNKDIAQCAAVTGSMSLKEAELQAKVDSQDVKINTLEADNAAMKARMTQLEAMVKALAAK